MKLDFKTRETKVSNAIQIIFFVDSDNSIMTSDDEFISSVIENFECNVEVFDEEDDEYDYRKNYIIRLDSDSLDEYKTLKAKLDSIERENVIVNLYYNDSIF
jgi:hypothetical protein